MAQSSFSGCLFFQDTCRGWTADVRPFVCICCRDGRNCNKGLWTGRRAGWICPTLRCSVDSTRRLSRAWFCWCSLRENHRGCGSWTNTVLRICFQPIFHRGCKRCKWWRNRVGLLRGTGWWIRGNWIWRNSRVRRANWARLQARWAGIRWDIGCFDCLIGLSHRVLGRFCCSCVCFHVYTARHSLWFFKEGGCHKPLGVGIITEFVIGKCAWDMLKLGLEKAFWKTYPHADIVCVCE